jgi:DNA-binding CsgD family transcriptional regulator
MKQIDIESSVSELIGNIYDCTVDPALWSETLSQVVSFCNAQAGVIGSRNVTTLETNWMTSKNIAPTYADLHCSTYGKIDPMNGMLLQMPGRAVPMDHLISWNDFVDSKFYQEWAIPQSWVDWTSVMLDKSARDVTMICITTDHSVGRIDEIRNARIDYLGPHLYRAFQIGKLIERKNTEKSALAETIDGLAAGIFLVNASGVIVHANPAGQTALMSSGVLQSMRGRLAAQIPKTDAGLQRAVADAAKPLAQGASMCLTSGAGERYMVHILPLRETTRSQTLLSTAPVAAVFICPVETYKRTLPEVVGAALGLTPMELRVLLALVEGCNVTEAANALGVASSTVKTHLTRIFSKTGVNRQSELVKLATGFVSPLAK